MSQVDMSGSDLRVTELDTRPDKGNRIFPNT